MKKSVALAMLLLPAGVAGQAPNIPETWDDEGMAAFELPLATPEFSPRHVPASYYYALPVRPVYRSYPVYHPDREPPGYLEELETKEPDVVFDASRIQSEAEWIAAGELVFHAPISYVSVVLTMEDVRDPSWYGELDVPITRDGVLPFVSYVVREKGKVELGQLSCAMCHTRVMPDGSTIPGAQGNFPFDPAFARLLERNEALHRIAPQLIHALVGVPWVESAEARLRELTLEEIVAAFRAVPKGVLIRQGTSLYYPAKVPDLIGLRERNYLDATGFVRHRSIGDIMRYAAVNQTLDALASYGDFIPAGVEQKKLPPPGEGRFVGTDSRYGDPQLYALAKYVYSLEPPPSPHPYDERARRGEDVFSSAGCAICHTPPLYTNNTLIPAPGFEPPPEHWTRYDILDAEVGTDPHLALETRRGTGYYKVPSLKGLWYRGALHHNGAVSSLEEWLDPKRLEGGVVGHPFGLELSAAERDALIAFLKTL